MTPAAPEKRSGDRDAAHTGTTRGGVMTASSRDYAVDGPGPLMGVSRRLTQVARSDLRVQYGE
jgi:hypothetical protein